MARSKNGCLKILACAGAGSDPSAGSDGDADEHPDENKAMSDKSRWSFRRRSTRHRVLKNSDISEPETLSSSKAKSDITPSNSVYSSTYSYTSEKPLHQDKPEEKTLHLEKPEEKPLHEEKSDEKMMEKPIEKLVDKLMEEPADQIIERSIEKIAEMPTEEESEKLTGIPMEEPAEKVTEAEPEDQAKMVFGSPIEETPERTAGELIEMPSGSSPVTSAGIKEEEPDSLVEGSSGDPKDRHLESAAVVIQSSIRTCVETQELLNEKNLVKLQAVIRGHLVRSQASTSLQCLLAIVKMQELIRARQAQQSGGKFQEVAVHSSSEKLLCNAFALKLMDRTLTSKSIHVKCDPSESDVTWKWMERWTTLIPPIARVELPEHIENSVSVGEKVQENAQHDDKIITLDSENSVSVGEKLQENAQHDANIIPLNADISFPELVLDDVKETLGTSDSRASEALAFNQDERTEVEIKDDAELEFVHDEHETNQKTENDEGESLESLDQQSTQADVSRELSPLPEKSESSNEDISDSCNTEETIEVEGKQLPRKSCNPAFAAAQLKFEELSTNSTISKSGSSSYLDGTSKPKANISHSQEDYPSKLDNDTGIPESSIGQDTKMVVAASECGTEISISSTLDSPDRSEGDGGEIVLEIGALENRNYATDTMHSEVKTSPEVEAQLQKDVQQNGHVSDAGVATDPELIQERHVELEKSDSHDRLVKSVESYATPEGTPISRATVAESHGTPSSDVSVNTKKSKSIKPLSLSSKRSLASPNRDSVGRSSTDNFSKDSRQAKIENSSKVGKSDNADQEPRISNSNPLPSYMQFTESARAKASANMSPKMSPDVQDSHPRKRHSLPMTNGKQDSSPRMQRSSSQAQQNVKSNGAVPQSSSDKRWHI